MACPVSLTAVPGERISHLNMLRMLSPGLDLSRCVEGGRVSNLPLDLKQFSLTHVIQVSGLPLWYTASQLVPFPTCYGPVRVSPFGESADLTGLSSTCDALRIILHAAMRRTTSSPGFKKTTQKRTSRKDATTRPNNPKAIPTAGWAANAEPTRPRGNKTSNHCPHRQATLSPPRKLASASSIGVTAPVSSPPRFLAGASSYWLK